MGASKTIWLHRGQGNTGGPRVAMGSEVPGLQRLSMQWQLAGRYYGECVIAQPDSYWMATRAVWHPSGVVATRPELQGKRCRLSHGGCGVSPPALSHEAAA